MLGLAWLGIWGVWLPGHSASLQQHAIDFAEWTTFLIDVRSGDMLRMPDVLRLGLMLAVVAMAISAVAIKNGWVRWGIRLITLIPAVVMLPPYPQLLEFWFSDSYGLRFGACSVAFAGVLACVLIDRLSGRSKSFILLAVVVLSFGLSLWAYVVLRVPFTIHLGRMFGPGWGTLLFGMGLVAALVMQAILIARMNQKSPTS